MKVIKNEEVPTIEKKVDEKAIAEMKEKFDTLQTQLNTKEYSVLLNAEQTSFLLDTVYENIEWKGYESYAISETNTVFRNLVQKGEINGTARPEIIEAIFHFLKNYAGKGVKNATLFRQICDQFAIPMTELNQDRQTLRDVSLELVSAEQGIPIEQVISNLQSEING
jgi:hypothetical protein